MPGSIRDDTASRHAHDRLTYLFAAFVGYNATVTLKSRESFSGVFSAASLESPESAIVLKMTRRLRASGDTGDYVGNDADHAVAFDVNDLAILNVPAVVTDRAQVKMANDTDISGHLETRERKLEEWNDTSGPTGNLSLNGSRGDWDQFAANEKMFGLKSDFDETLYTTAIDRSAPSYRERALRADKIAREIEGSATTNTHVAEERNIASPEANGMDEEANGVARSFAPLEPSSPNKYTPPARRAPTGQATVAGAPVDPAIISASLARPSSKSAKAAPEPEKENTVPSPIPSSSAGSLATKVEGAKPASIPALPRVQPTTPAPTASSNVEHDVRDAFKGWSASERLKAAEVQRQYLEQQKTKQKKDRETKFNDLKMFSANFKLKSKVPQDILGILARDKDKQKEIERKADGQTLPKSPETSPVASTPPLPQANGRANKTAAQQRLPGNLGQRLLANQQTSTRNFTSQPPPPRATPDRTASGMSVPGGSLNVQALEFKPNPAASMFQPSETSRVASPKKPADPKPRERVLNRVAFFGDKKPTGGKKIADAFNPVARMVKEAAADEKATKEYAANGGIPQAYRTPPTWPVSEENKERGYLDLVAQATATPALPFAQHAQAQGQAQQYFPPRTPGFRNNATRDYYDDPRMHLAHHAPGSAQSSVQPSPNMRAAMLAQPLNYPPHMFPQQPMTPGRQFSGYMQAPPMMMTPSQQAQHGHYMPPAGQMGQMPGQMSGQMSMYNPNNGQLYAVPAGQGFASPQGRQAPLMMHQGSQGMHMGMNMQGMQMQNMQNMQGMQNMGMHMGYGAPGPGFQPQAMPMRGGAPMAQGSFGSSPGMAAGVPAGNAGGPAGRGQYPMMPGQSQPQSQPQPGKPGTPMRYPSEPAEIK